MLSPKTIRIASGPNYGILTTRMPDGTANSHMMWVHADSEYLYMNTEIHRRKFRNIQADPRVTVVVFEGDNPYSWCEIRGTVIETVAGAEGRSHIDELAFKYTGAEYTNPIRTERVKMKIRPDYEYRFPEGKFEG